MFPFIFGLSEPGFTKPLPVFQTLRSAMGRGDLWQRVLPAGGSLVLPLAPNACRGSTEEKGWEWRCDWMDGAAAASPVAECLAEGAQAGSGVAVFIS